MLVFCVSRSICVSQFEPNSGPLVYFTSSKSEEVSNMNRILQRTTRALKAVAVGAAILVLSGCASTLSSNVQSVEDTRLNDLATYAWLGGDSALGNTSAPEVINPINRDRVRAAINDELAAKGYKQVDIAEADFIVAATLGANEQLQLNQRFNSIGFAGGRGFRRGFRGGFRGGFGRGVGGFSRFGGGFGGYNSVSINQVTEGVLVLNVFENRTKEAIWHGAASKRLSKSFMAPELIDEAVTTLLEQFPDQDVLAEEMELMLNDKVS